MEEQTSQELSQFLPLSDPYPSKVPSKILQREYLIKELSLKEEEVQSFFPLTELLNNSTIKTYLSMFKYMKAGIKLKFLLLSTQMQYGLISVSFLPHTTDKDSWKRKSQLSQANSHLLDISEQNAYELSLPFLNPNLYYDLSVESIPSWRVDVWPICVNTVSIATANDVQMQVFASFTDIETAGYVGESVMPAQFQSYPGSNPLWPSRIGRTSALAAGIMGAASTVGSWLYNSIPDPVNTVQTLNEAYASTIHIRGLAESVATNMGWSTPETATDPAKLVLCSDLSTPTVGTSVNVLGDALPKTHSGLPSIHNITDLRDMAFIPTFLDCSFTGETATTIYEVHPFLPGTYGSYLAPMFKYYRGGTRVLFKFNTSQLVSARVKIVLSPTGEDFSGPHSLGDLPSWVVTVRGSTKFCLDIPYLAETPWSEVTSPRKPKVMVSLLDSIPQPFDKPVGVYTTVFVAASNDLQLCGLQSCVSTDKATFQCSLAEEFSKPDAEFSRSYDFPYQGGVQSIGHCLARFSSRSPDPSNLFPFPIKITSRARLLQLDNFDYVSNLFKFYTGDTNVKMLFSKGAANGLLKVSIDNSNSEPLSQVWKCGNSMALTDQTVWPMLEFRYPYMNKNQIDSIWEPTGMYKQMVDNTAELSEFFVSATDNFGLFYLLPVPDFFFEEEEATNPELEEKAVFQASVHPRYVGSACYFGKLDITTGSSNRVTNQQLDPTFETNATVTIDFSCCLRRKSGSTDCNFFVLISSTNVAQGTVPGYVLKRSSTYLALPLIWTDLTNSGSYAATAQATVSLGIFPGSPPGLVLSVVNDDTSSSEYDFVYTLRCSAFSGGVYLTNTEFTGGTVGNVDIKTSPLSITASSPIPTTTDQTISVFVENDPEVHVSSLPDLHISTMPDVTVAGDVSVYPSLPTKQENPFWVSSYKP